MLKNLAIPFSGSGPKEPAQTAAQLKQRVYNKTTIKQEIRPFWLYASYVLIGANMLVGLWYLLGVNSYAAKGFEIKSAQKNIEQLSQENKKLNVKISEQSSLVNVQNTLVSSQFVPVSQVKFLAMPSQNERSLTYGKR